MLICNELNLVDPNQNRNLLLRIFNIFVNNNSKFDDLNTKKKKHKQKSEYESYQAKSPYK